MQVGVLDDVLTNVDNVIRKGRLGPGQTLVADLSSGTFKENMQIAKEVGSRAPYEEWLSSSTRLKDLNASGYSRECLMPSSEVRTAVRCHVRAASTAVSTSLDGACTPNGAAACAAFQQAARSQSPAATERNLAAATCVPRLQCISVSLNA